MDKKQANDCYFLVRKFIESRLDAINRLQRDADKNYDSILMYRHEIELLQIMEETLYDHATHGLTDIQLPDPGTYHREYRKR